MEATSLVVLMFLVVVVVTENKCTPCQQTCSMFVHKSFCRESCHNYCSEPFGTEMKLMKIHVSFRVEANRMILPTEVHAHMANSFEAMFDSEHHEDRPSAIIKRIGPDMTHNSFVVQIEWKAFFSTDSHGIEFMRNIFNDMRLPMKIVLTDIH